MKKIKMTENVQIIFLIIVLIVLLFVIRIRDNMKDVEMIITPEEETTTISEIYESYDMTPEGPDNGLERIDIHEVSLRNMTDKTVGSSGRNLINNYSVASATLPLGLIIYIESDDGYISGYYRVDDNECNKELIIYCNNKEQTVPCTVWLAGVRPS